MELSIIHWLQSIRSGFLDSFFFLFSAFAEYGCFVLVFVWLLLFYRKKLYAYFIVTYGAAVGINFLLKQLFARMRPWMADRSVAAIFERNTDYSFPSGHSVSIAVAACFATFFVYKTVRAKGWRICATIGIWTITILCAVSRMYLGQHYLSDIFTGICLGIFVSLVGISVYRHCQKFTKNPAD